jgi:hypothetical protein
MGGDRWSNLVAQHAAHLVHEFARRIRLLSLEVLSRRDTRFA